MTLKESTFAAIGIFVALAGCDGASGGASSASGSGDASSASGSGGASSASGSGGASSASGSGGASSASGSGGAAAGCPELRPDALEACDTSEKCIYDAYSGVCSKNLPVEASCVEGEWHVLEPLTCEPLPASLSCDPFGTWLVEPDELVSDYDLETLSRYSGPFEVNISRGENGFAYILNHAGHSLSADGCLLYVFTIFPMKCYEEEGEVFCDAFWRTATIDFSKVPIEASITVTLEGEASGTATATAKVTKKM